MQRITIVGAGAIGGWLGQGLAAAGADVSVLARGATLDAIRAHGLRVRQGQGAEAVERAAPVRASDRAAELGPQDLVVIAVKAPALPALAPQIAPLLGPETAVLTAMNGVPWWFLHGLGGPLDGGALASVDADGGIARAIAPARVIGGVVHASCSLDGPGIARQHFGNKLIVGEPNGADTPRLQALADWLRRGGFETEVSPRIQRDIWFKLWGNMTMNPISAVTGATTDRVLADDDLRGFLTAAMREAQTVGAHIGLPIDQTPEDRHVVTRKLGSFKTSMLQDAEAGRPIELDALVGAVLELGRLTGTPMPFTSALMGVSRVFAQGRGLYA